MKRNETNWCCCNRLLQTKCELNTYNQEYFYDLDETRFVGFKDIWNLPKIEKQI